MTSPTWTKDRLKLYHADCMDIMREFPDKYFDLAIVDPPYGIGWDGEKFAMYENTSAKWKTPQVANCYDKKEWDKTVPSLEYFVELRRVSKHQIVWGGNYFTDKLPPSGGWVVWVKGTAEGMSLSEAELAWTNSINNIKIIELLWAGFRRCEAVLRIHPTQKPVALYRWLLSKYATPGQRILDTHLGSGSHAIAAHFAGMDFTGIELDADYFNAAVKRIDAETAQLEMPLFGAPTSEESSEVDEGPTLC